MINQRCSTQLDCVCFSMSSALPLSQGDPEMEMLECESSAAAHKCKFMSHAHSCGGGQGRDEFLCLAHSVTVTTSRLVLQSEAVV